MSMGKRLETLAKEHPDKIAVIFNDKKITYSQLNLRATKFANSISGLGIGKGEKVATVLRNCSNYIEVIQGLAKIGAVHVPVNWRLAPAEIEYILKNSDSNAVVVGQEFVDKIEAIRTNLKLADSNCIFIGDNTPHSMIAYEQFLAHTSDSEPQVEIGEEDAFFIGYTSGTTGFPKGAVTKHGNWERASMGQGLIFNRGEDDVELLTMPLFHMNAINTTSMSLYKGSTVIIMERFRPEEALRLIDKEKVTFSSMVPTMYNRILNLPEEVKNKFNVDSMRTLLQSSAPIPFNTKKGVIEFFRNACLHEVYGGTEAGVVTYLAPEDQLRKPGSVGKASPGVEIKIVDDDGNEVPTGEVGQFTSRSMTAKVHNYYKDEKSTSKHFKDGWFYSGDMARVDEEGYYYLVDRKFDMIISGGENIYPAEIEGVLYQHPKVFEVAVIGVPDADWGESVKAVIVLKEGETATEDEIIQYTKERLGGFKIPRSVDFVNEMP
ncbi:MAG: AMP-binding protein, partial [Thermodesulfobacteriota bacterium]|nr:AMP-binding protein [Thermodesulfobacteriota bacterium]